ncbi:MAG TPA: hypothetical protein VJP80_06105 [Candidatus Saccharimonadales bacterium]|nr:hypothetical protein [Candidatus Saccharimonadales bacterium]
MDIEKIIRGYVPNVVHMSLGTCVNNRPWVCEVHFAYDDELNLYFRSLVSRRHSQEIAENPLVAGNIVRQHQLGEYPLGVYFEGVAKKLDTSTERQKAFSAINGRLHTGDDILKEAEDPKGHQFYKITVNNWYVFGKLDDTGGKKYTLEWSGGEQ